MEIRVLKYFLAVAREENITRAAESLNISDDNAIFIIGYTIIKIIIIKPIEPIAFLLLMNIQPQKKLHLIVIYLR